MQDSWRDNIELAGLVCGCVLQKDDKYLLVQEKLAKAYGLWNIPAGYVDKGETLEEAAKREAKEECGYDVEVGELILVSHDSVEESVKHAFKGTITGGELKFQTNELLDAKWLSFKEVEALNNKGKIRAKWTFEAIKIVENAQ